jgi:hypothetical protein
MKKVSYLFVCAVLVLTMSGIVAVHAQDAVDTTSLNDVVQAYANTLASTSLHIESQTQVDSTNQQGQTTSQKTSASFDASKDQDTWDVSGHRVTAFNTQAGEVDITTDTIVLGGEVYMQITGMPQFQGGQGGQQGQGGGQFSIPQGWFDATQMAANNQRVPIGGATDAKTVVSTLLDALNLPVTAQSVTALKELPADTIDNQSMRVFQLTLDPAIILQSDAAALLRGGGFGGFGGLGGGFAGRRPGANGQGQGQGAPAANGTPFPTRQPPNPADYQITFAVYVGDQDQLIHRIYSVIAVSPNADETNAGTRAARTITTQIDFTNFNVPVTITAPQVSS